MSSSPQTTRVGMLTVSMAWGKSTAAAAESPARGAAGRRPIQVATAVQTGAPHGTVLGFDCLRQPQRRLRALGNFGIGKKQPETAIVVLRQQLLGVWSNQKIHVGAGGLLRRVGFEFAQEGAGVRRVDDGQLANPLWQLVGQAQTKAPSGKPCMNMSTGRPRSPTVRQLRVMPCGNGCRKVSIMVCAALEDQ
jgi:hypothetical protein